MTTEPIPRWPGYKETELIGGVECRLGDMTLNQLLELEAECAERIEDAVHEHSVVRDYRERMFPEVVAEVIPIGLGRLLKEGVVRRMPGEDNSPPTIA